MAAQLLRKYSSKISANWIRRLGNIWPPFLGAGIRISLTSADYRHIKVRLKRSWYNSNYVGTQFGGSIYAMTDPFYMLMIINNLGPEYVVWDKSAQIEFIKPGRAELHAEFIITEEILAQIKRNTDQNEKYIFTLPVEVKDPEGLLIAKVEKTIYVRRKKMEPEKSS